MAENVFEWPLSWYKFSAAKFYLRSFSQVSSSQWTQRKNVYGPHAQLWMCQLTLTIQNKDFWNPMEAFFAELGGQAGKMRIGDPARLAPQWNAATAPVTSAWSDGTSFDTGTGWNSSPLPPTIYVAESAARGDTSVVVGGLPVSTSRVIRRNDRIEFRVNGIATEVPRFHSVMRDAPTDASGLTRLQIRPALRDGLAIGDQGVLSYPTCVFYTADDDQGIFDRKPAMLADASFNLIEAVI